LSELHRAIFQRAHASHRSCRADEWLMTPCRAPDGEPLAPLVWSRRNGPWTRVRALWVGAAPGNAGSRGSGALGAHGTRIPFGGDIAGGNLDVLFASIGLTRNDTFIVAAANQLPARGGGEPSPAEIAQAVGDYPDSVALLRDTVVAAGPELIVALGHVALRALAAAVTREDDAAVGAAPRSVPPPRLPTMQRLGRAGFSRGTAAPWPQEELPLVPGLRTAWRAAWHDEPAFHVLPLMHPSAQNMSPFAGPETAFYRRMVETRAALIGAAAQVLGIEPPVPRPPIPAAGGIYDLPEWRERIAERHARFDRLWRERGV
jgi:uracil-DNA glycosylase